MCRNGSRSRRPPPAKARRTGKPSPSKPDGAVVTERLRRRTVRGAGTGTRARGVVSSTVTAGMTASSRLRAQLRAHCKPVRPGSLPRSAPARGVSRSGTAGLPNVTGAGQGVSALTSPRSRTPVPCGRCGSALTAWSTQTPRTLDDRTTMFSTPRRGRAAVLTVSAAVALGQLALAAPALAHPPTATAPTLAAGTQFFTPPPDPGAVQQVSDLARQHRDADAALITGEVSTPQAVWFTDGTPQQVQKEVRNTVLEAKAAHTVPTLVVYNAPGRDCAQSSAGGADEQAAYQAWADGFARGLVANQQVIVVIEPDGLANLPSDCGAAYTGDPQNPTDAERIAEIRYAGEVIEKAAPNALVYLDAGHSGWHSVADTTTRLDQA